MCYASLCFFNFVTGDKALKSNLYIAGCLAVLSTRNPQQPSFSEKTARADRAMVGEHGMTCWNEEEKNAEKSIIKKSKVKHLS